MAVTIWTIKGHLQSRNPMSRRRTLLLLVTFIILTLWLCTKNMKIGPPVQWHFRSTANDNVSDQVPKLNKVLTADYSVVRWPNVWNPVRELSKGYERLPFPLEVTDDLPNAGSVILDCQKQLGYVFFVHTAPGHCRHREVLRNAIGVHSSFSRHNWTVVFFVGISDNKSALGMIEAEAAEHGDMVILPYRDTYRNLTYKFVYGIKWVMEYCPSVKYVVKVDDDIVINLAKIMKYLDTASKFKTRVFYCRVLHDEPVRRETDSPWFLSEDLYPKKYFSDYCSGRAVVFQSELLRPLYNATFYLPFHGVDDVFVTSDAASVARIEHVDFSSLVSHDERNWGQVVEGVIMFCHIPDLELRTRSWDIIAKNLTERFQLHQSDRVIVNTTGTQTF